MSGSRRKQIPVPALHQQQERGKGRTEKTLPTPLQPWATGENRDSPEASGSRASMGEVNVSRSMGTPKFPVSVRYTGTFPSHCTSYLGTPALGGGKGGVGPYGEGVGNHPEASRSSASNLEGPR